MQQNKHCLKFYFKGITLIELMLVLMIIAVVGMAITGRIISGIEKAKLLAAGRQLVSHIRLAQERAKLEQRNITVELSAENETYKIYQAGLSFDGSGDVVTVSDSTSLKITGDLTVEFWIKPTNIVAGRQNIVDKAYGGEFAFTQETNGSISFYYGTCGGRCTPYQGFGSGANSAVQNEWHHFALVRNLTSMMLYWYKDGSQIASTSASYASATASSYNVTIGYGDTGIYYNGFISEVRIYNRALTQEEIQYSYTYKKPQNRAGLVGWWKLDEGQGSTCYDSSGYGNNGTITGATWSQGVLGYLKDPAKGYQGINYDFDNLSEFKGVKIYSVDFDGTTITNSSKFSFDSSGRPKVGTENLSANGTIVLTCGSHNLTITVHRITGEVTME
ncbi:MAG: hypothetical protein NC920_03600 [Candidatus Omnitrophica bacterium]|nr:hypothetical protein [Candidatus Omnitrophota bacterium]